MEGQLRKKWVPGEKEANLVTSAVYSHHERGLSEVETGHQIQPGFDLTHLQVADEGRTLQLQPQTLVTLYI